MGIASRHFFTYHELNFIFYFLLEQAEVFIYFPLSFVLLLLSQLELLALFDSLLAFNLSQLASGGCGALLVLSLLA